MKKVYLAFGIHNHQPVGNFDFVFEDAYNKAYLPFLELLERHPKIRMAQHYTGILFHWIKQHKPEFLPKLKKIVQTGQIEMMTGGFYEPIMGVIPEQDKIGQIQMLTQFVEENTGYHPEGMWLAERIWEPHIPKPASKAGIKYVVLDDSHFKSAGLQEEQLLGYYITEEEGATVYLFPISETLRYSIPFQEPEATISFLKSIAAEQEQILVVFADDGEKFGVWPGTYEHCYTKAWLDEFFSALEQNLDWIQMVHFSEALEQVKPLGRIYLPTASYREMMEWAMPTQAINAYERFEDELKKYDLHDKYKVFVRGGFWRNFMSKYPESNNMHKKMLNLSKRLTRLEPRFKSDENYQKARNHLWAGQCNCPYWHGVFGGLYLNHLRYATYHEFIQAERILDTLERSPEELEKGWLHCEVFDYDSDGLDEVVLTNKSMNLYFAPEKGGCLFELDFKPLALNLLDTMTRRPESYHKKLLELKNRPSTMSEHNEEILSIHDLVILKEEGLQNRLFYDWYRRTSLLDHFLAEDTTLEQFSKCEYTELGDFVETPYEYSFQNDEHSAVLSFWRNGRVQFADGSAPVRLQKEIHIDRIKAKLIIQYDIINLDNQTRAFWFGTELDFALLAGDAPDRYFTIPGHALKNNRLRSAGAVTNAGKILLTDEWLGVCVSLKLKTADVLWRFPIETVTQSESGFERVYQSSVVFPNWKILLPAGGAWSNQIELTLEELKR